MENSLKLENQFPYGFFGYACHFGNKNITDNPGNGAFVQLYSPSTFLRWYPVYLAG